MMKKLSGAAAVLAALMMLFVAGCEQSSGGGESSDGGDGGATSKNRVDVTWTFKECNDNSIVAGALKNGDTAEFKADGTWSMGTFASGTYDDVNASEDGTFNAEVTEILGGMIPITESIPATITISGDTLTVSINLASIKLGDEPIGSATVIFGRG